MKQIQLHEKYLFCWQGKHGIIDPTARDHDGQVVFVMDIVAINKDTNDGLYEIEAADGWSGLAFADELDLAAGLFRSFG